MTNIVCVHVMPISVFLSRRFIEKCSMLLPWFVKEQSCTPNLYGVWVTGLSQNFQKRWIRDKEETGKHKSFLFQITAWKQIRNVWSTKAHTIYSKFSYSLFKTISWEQRGQISLSSTNDSTANNAFEKYNPQYSLLLVFHTQEMKIKRLISYPVSDFWQSSSCSSKWGNSWPRVSSPTQHWTTLGVSCARVKIFTQDLSMLANRLAS